jgi:hypothetical protein
MSPKLNWIALIRCTIFEGGFRDICGMRADEGGCGGKGFAI